MDAEDQVDRPTSPRGRPFALTFLVGTAALTVTLAGMRSVADIVTPVFLALVITLTVHPIRTRLERTRIPEWASSVVLLIAAYLVILVFSIALAVSLAELAVLIPQYATDITEGVADLAGTLQGLGVDEQEIERLAGVIDPGQLLDLAEALLSGMLGALSDLLFLFTVLLFMAFDTNGTRRNLAALGNRFPDPVAALRRFAQGTRSYIGVSALFGLIVAVIDGAVLYLLDVPGAFAWAVLAFVTNFIPNIGFVIGLVPPALIALLEDGPGLMLTVIALYCVINFVIQSIIQPRVVGDTVGLTPTLTFLSLVFWTWLLGPLAALLAVPFTLLVRALLVEADPGASWALPLISGKREPVPEPAPSPVTPAE